MMKYWKTAFWLLIISILLLLPGKTLPKKSFFSFEHFDKIVHFGIFVVLQVLFLFESNWGNTPLSFRYIRNAFIVFTAYAITTELLQLWISSERSGEWLDGLMDILGLLFGIVLYRYGYRFINRSSLWNF